MIWRRSREKGDKKVIDPKARAIGDEAFNPYPEGDLHHAILAAEPCEKHDYIGCDECHQPYSLREDFRALDDTTTGCLWIIIAMILFVLGSFIFGY